MDPAQPDVIDLLAGIAPGSKLDVLRRERPVARENAQLSYLALFMPAEVGEFSLAERGAVAAFVAGLHRDDPIAAHYAGELGKMIAAVAAEAATTGPYGRFPAGVLSREDQVGLSWRVAEDARAALGARLCAAFEHAHLLVFHPRDAEPAALERLLDAGWTTTGIVTLSQLIAFLSFQIRVVAGLRVLGI
jgi:CMD domain protein